MQTKQTGSRGLYDITAYIKQSVGTWSLRTRKNKIIFNINFFWKRHTHLTMVFMLRCTIEKAGSAKLLGTMTKWPIQIKHSYHKKHFEPEVGQPSNTNFLKKRNTEQTMFKLMERYANCLWRSCMTLILHSFGDGGNSGRRHWHGMAEVNAETRPLLYASSCWLCQECASRRFIGNNKLSCLCKHIFSLLWVWT